MWIPRDIEPRLQRSARTRPVVVLTGARQTGKTSTFRRLFPNDDFVSLDLPTEAEQAEKEPQSFLRRHLPPVIIDEVAIRAWLIPVPQGGGGCQPNPQWTIPAHRLSKVHADEECFRVTGGDGPTLQNWKHCPLRRSVRRCRKHCSKPPSCGAAFRSCMPTQTSMGRPSTTLIWLPTWNATCVRSPTWAVCGISSAFCALALSVPQTYSTKPIWPEILASLPPPRTIGCPRSRLPGRSCCSSHGSRTEPSPSP